MQRQEKLKLQDEPHCCLDKESAVESFNWDLLTAGKSTAAVGHKGAHCYWAMKSQDLETSWDWWTVNKSQCDGMAESSRG